MRTPSFVPAWTGTLPLPVQFASPLEAVGPLSSNGAPTATPDSFTNVAVTCLGRSLRNGEWEHAFEDPHLLELHARMRVDRIDRRQPGNLEEQRQVGLARLDVELERLARRPLVGVVGRIAAGWIGLALVDEGADGALIRIADLPVVAGTRGAAESRCLRLNRGVADTGIGEALSEARAAGEGCCIDLQLQVPLVHPPVADVDAQRQEEREDGEEQSDEDEDAAVLVRCETDSGCGVHTHGPPPAKSADCSIRIVAFPRSVIVAPKGRL